MPSREVIYSLQSDLVAGGGGDDGGTKCRRVVVEARGVPRW